MPRKPPICGEAEVRPLIQSSWSNTATVLCLTIAAIVMALQQALSGAPDVRKVMPHFVLSPLVNYVPLAFMILAGLTWLADRWEKRRTAQQASVAGEHGPTSPSATPVATITGHTPSSPNDVEVERINFDYLPDSPLNHGWTLGYKDNVPGPGAKWLVPTDARAPGCISIEMDDLNCAIDFRVSQNGALSDRLACDVKFSDSTMLFVRVQLGSRDGSQTTKLIKYILGTESASPTKGWEEFEWTLPISPPALPNGWRRLDISFADSVNQTWARFGWSFRSVRMIRLRGKLCISPIRLYAQSINGDES
jgi:hypothetical protein